MNQYIHPKEKRYFIVSLIVSVLIYAALVIGTLGIGIVYGLLGALVVFVAQGIGVGRLRGNGVRVSEQQFPVLHGLALRLSQRLGLAEVPAIYVVQAGGAINAFATRFVSRNFVVVYSDVVELAYERGEAELAFVLAHELAHVKLGHLAKKFWLYPAKFVPFLSQAYSRACEYSCDAIGAALEPEGAVRGVMVLASGKRLYREMNEASFIDQARQRGDVWTWLAEHLASHPNLPKRVDAVGQARADTPQSEATSPATIAQLQR